MIPEETITHIARLLLAAFLGGLIGFERDVHGRPAGLRTNLLVSMGSAIFVILSEYISLAGPPIGEGMVSTNDPARIAAQVVTGIGFLGAGAIIKEGLTIRGLTTAACLWIVAGIGMAAGAGYYSVAIAATFISLASLIGLSYFEKFYPKDSYRKLTITTTSDADVSKIIDTVKNKYLKIILFNFERNYDTGTTTLRLDLRLFHRGITDKLSHNIVKSLEETKIPIKCIKWDR